MLKKRIILQNWLLLSFLDCDKENSEKYGRAFFGFNLMEKITNEFETAPYKIPISSFRIFEPSCGKDFLLLSFSIINWEANVLRKLHLCNWQHSWTLEVGALPLNPFFSLLDEGNERLSFAHERDVYICDYHYKRVFVTDYAQYWNYATSHLTSSKITKSKAVQKGYRCIRYCSPQWHFKIVTEPVPWYAKALYWLGLYTPPSKKIWWVINLWLSVLTH